MMINEKALKEWMSEVNRRLDESTDAWFDLILYDLKEEVFNNTEVEE